MKWDNLAPLIGLKTLVDEVPWVPKSRHDDMNHGSTFLPDMTVFNTIVDRLPNAGREPYGKLIIVVPGWMIYASGESDSKGQTHYQSEVTLWWDGKGKKWDIYRCETGDETTF